MQQNLMKTRTILKDIITISEIWSTARMQYISAAVSKQWTDLSEDILEGDVRPWGRD
jgi:hypothetical protein